MARLSSPPSVGGGSTDGVASRLLLTPAAAAENAITIKRPNSSWGVGQPYGSGQAFELLKESAAATDVGYTGVSPNDLVLLRVTSDGALGMGGNLHLATGLRQPQGYTSAYAMFIQSYVDAQLIAMQTMVAAPAALAMRLADSVGTDRFRLRADGNGVFGIINTNGRGALVGDVGAAGADYFGIAHSSQATSSNFALAQGGNGDTVVNAATGQTVTLRIANAVRLTVSSTGMGFNGTAAIAKPAVTGSRAANAALASLLTQLAAYGLVTDSSTA